MVLRKVPDLLFGNVVLPPSAEVEVLVLFRLVILLLSTEVSTSFAVEPDSEETGLSVFVLPKLGAVKAEVELLVKVLGEFVNV